MVCVWIPFFAEIGGSAGCHWVIVIGLLNDDALVRRERAGSFGLDPDFGDRGVHVLQPFQ